MLACSPASMKSKGANAGLGADGQNARGLDLVEHVPGTAAPPSVVESNAAVTYAAIVFGTCDSPLPVPEVRRPRPSPRGKAGSPQIPALSMPTGAVEVRGRVDGFQRDAPAISIATSANAARDRGRGPSGREIRVLPFRVAQRYGTAHRLDVAATRSPPAGSARRSLPRDRPPAGIPSWRAGRPRRLNFAVARAGDAASPAPAGNPGAGRRVGPDRSMSSATERPSVTGRLAKPTIARFRARQRDREALEPVAIEEADGEAFSRRPARQRQPRETDLSVARKRRRVRGGWTSSKLSPSFSSALVHRVAGMERPDQGDAAQRWHHRLLTHPVQREPHLERLAPEPVRRLKKTGSAWRRGGVCPVRGSRAPPGPTGALSAIRDAPRTA